MDKIKKVSFFESCKEKSNREFREYEILDGQQRLTTLCMMMAVIRDLIKKPQYKYTLSQMIYQEENELLKVPSRNRIKYNTRDKEIGRAHV